MLLAHKAEVDARAVNGSTALHMAAASGFKDVVELLLANKASINASDYAGKTPLDWASEFGHKVVAEFLRQQGGHE
jgi:serine/threonine-protein phosphatase 6 regulatory ankyrin repeat subunit B